MDVILSPLKWQFALVYLDKIVVCWRSPRDSINLVKQFLSLLQDTKVSLKVKNCNFFTGTVDYLGHAVHPRRLEIATHTPTAIRELKPLEKITKLRLFLGICNLFLRFMSSFA